jgi:hypothetical protein
VNGKKESMLAATVDFEDWYHIPVDTFRHAIRYAGEPLIIWP